MNNETLIKISSKINELYKGKIMIIVFMTLTTIFGILQILLFLTGVLLINGTSINETDNWLVTLVWISTAISLLSCYTGFLGAISNIRGSNTFLIWMTIQLTMLSMVALLAGALFAAISSLFGLISAFVRYYVWKNDLVEKWNLNKDKLKIIAIIIFTIICSTFILIVWGCSEKSSFWDNSEPNKWLWYFDAIGAALEICAYAFLIFKVWWAFAFFFISKFFFGVIYGVTGNVVSMVQMIMFSSTDISGMLAWLFLKPSYKK